MPNQFFGLLNQATSSYSKEDHKGKQTGQWPNDIIYNDTKTFILPMSLVQNKEQQGLVVKKSSGTRLHSKTGFDIPQMYDDGCYLT